MEYITQNDFQKMLLKSSDRIERNKEKINKINVFPVPDMDTGNNMAKTLGGIRDAIENKKFQNLEELSEAVLEGALVAAQGNAGVIYTGFLAGFLPLLDKNPLNAQKLAIAFETGAKRAKSSIQDPKEGTILDVINAATQTIQEEAKKEKDLVLIFKKAIKNSQEALLATRDKIEVLKKANVVDAGGLGFLMILESFLEALEGKKKKIKERPSEIIGKFIQRISYRYEVIFLIDNPKLTVDELKKKLDPLGNSLEALQIKNKIKVHIHTDNPEEIKKIARESGKILDLRTEDMAKEISGEESFRKVSIGIVAEDICDLPQKIIDKYQIEIAPAILDWPEVVNLPGENIYQKMREAEKRGIKELGKTSQPSVVTFLKAFKKQLERFEKVLCVTITSKLSGSFNSAYQATEMLDNPSRAYVIDSLNGSAGQALLILRAIELIQEQREIDEIVSELKKMTPKIHLYVFFEDPKWIEATGRITASQANWVRRLKKIGVRPFMTIKNGVVTKEGISTFAKDVSEALFKEIEKRSRKIRKQGKKIRVAITHADNPEGAKKLKKLLKEKIGAEVIFINLVCTLVGSRLGPGGMLAAWHVI